jgi:Mu transposase, C-terminal
MYDSQLHAKKAGLTFDLLEQLFIQAIVDGYMQEWDKLRRQTRYELWNHQVSLMGVNHWMGMQDDLKLLLMKAVNRKNPATGRYAIHPHHGLYFQGYRYMSPGLLNRLRGKEAEIYYDRRDISVIYLVCDGEFVGEAYCVELMGQRMSVWEAKALRVADKLASQEATATSLNSRPQIQKTATSGKRMLAQEAKQLEERRQLDRQREEIHPTHVMAVLQELQHLAPEAPPSLPSSILPDAQPETGMLPGKVLPTRKRGTSL